MTSNIVSFPMRPRVVLRCGLVSETRHHSCDGTTVTRHDPPVKTFFVDYEDEKGRLGIWDGQSYAAALDAGREWAVDGVQICDLTSETWGRA